jgi:alanine racemase
LSVAELVIDRNAVVINRRRLARLVGPAECAAVVKADAYGTGLEGTVRALVADGCRTFFVAHPIEGIRAREVAPEATIYVLNGLAPGGAGDYGPWRLRPVLGSPEEITEWQDYVHATELPGQAALHVDTGMNRLGLSPSDWGEAAARRRDNTLGFEITLLMSHLVSAEEPEASINALQLRSFSEARALFPGVKASLANSAGIFLGPEAHHDLVRPGYALYGGNPLPGEPNPMEPVVRMSSPILQVRDVRQGDAVGYNGTWITSRPSRIATVSLGYADGYPRSGSAPTGKHGAEAAVLGRICPVVGRISMDLLAIDVTDVPNAKRGDAAVFIGDELDVDRVGRNAGTIGYEILTQLGRRYPRREIG